MNRQLVGLSWIFFGILVTLVGMGNGLDWLPIFDDLFDEFWGIIAMTFGIVGLVMVTRESNRKE